MADLFGINHLTLSTADLDRLVGYYTELLGAALAFERAATGSDPWDPAHVRARPAWRMHEAIGPEALIVDDTGFLKDGDASACVARQYTGTAGKVTNCQVGVSVHLATDRASAALDWRLFVPASWDPACTAGKIAALLRS